MLLLWLVLFTRLALPGAIDIVAAYDIWDAGSGGNHYSAMPS
ncbi:hypothetical protein AB0M46_37740 [Dactylosporangium sp. NPDC051485]